MLTERDDLIIGMASGYSWEDLEPFAVSLKRTGYKGFCFLLDGEGPKDDVPRYGKTFTKRSGRTADMLYPWGIGMLDMGRFMEHPSIFRSCCIADFLSGETEYRNVICVDTKDVVFQSNPSEWLDQNLPKDRDIVVISEMQKYGQGDFTGNNKNMAEAFGETQLRMLYDNEIVNGGIIAGRSESIWHLNKQIFEQSLRDQRRRDGFMPSYKDMLPDQSALNIIIRLPEFKRRVWITQPQDGFAFGHPLTRFSTFKEDGLMYPAGSEKPYAIFHQYFDKPEWWQKVREKYHE